MTSVLEKGLITWQIRGLARPGAVLHERPLVIELAEKDNDKTDRDEPGRRKPGEGELLAHDAGVPVHGEGLEPLYGHAQDREEARDHRNNEETVDKGVLVAGDVKGGVEGKDPVEEEAEGEEDRGENVRVGEEAMSHGLVDELGNEDDGSDDAGHETDGAHYDVEIRKIHVDTEAK